MMVDNIDEISLNNNPTLDILKSNLSSLDTNYYKDFNITCKYYSEMGFVNRFGNDNRIIILNSNIQSINGKF